MGGNDWYGIADNIIAINGCCCTGVTGKEPVPMISMVDAVIIMGVYPRKFIRERFTYLNGLEG